MYRLEKKAEIAEAIKLAKSQSPDQVTETMRRLALGSLYFLLVFILGRADVDRDWIFDRCQEVQADPDQRLDLWARGHYKSTIITLALTIQDILKDPEITVGIFSHTRPIAKAFLRQIKREFETNDALKALFPEILWGNPYKESPKWSEDEGIVVKRKSNPKESTVEAWGLVDGQPTSKHFKLLVFDDVVTRESTGTPEMIQKTTGAWELALNLSAQEHKERYIGPRYHFNDTYREIINRGAVTPRIHPATIDGTVDGEPVLLTTAELAKKRKDMGSYTFACQMLLNPKAEEVQGFRIEWVKYWGRETLTGLNLYLLCDPASEKKKDSDYTVFQVIGLGPDQNYYLADMVRDRLSLTERANILFALHRQYRPLKVGYEKYGMQADIEHFKDRMERENYRFEIIELGGQMAKNDRIRRLIPLYEFGRVYIPRQILRNNYEGREVDLTQQFIYDEYNAFPVGSHDDMLDCQSRIVDPELGVVFPKPKTESEHSRNRRRDAMVI
ncbi:MAG: hypothetical protein HQK55_07990 [Deltaproteobacteria bacterium]|nr:hypothetical protein [Deltaproteobacteria bacterium]